MIVHPLESAGGRRHSPLSTLPSIALHGALIFGAVRLTAHVALAHDAPIHPTRIVYVAPRVPLPRARTVALPPAPHRTDDQFAPPVIEVPSIVPRTISTGQDIAPPPIDGEFRTGGISGHGASDGTPSPSLGSGIFSGEQVDRRVEPLGAGAVPAYPEALRNRAITGTVSAQFIVDTTGRVEPSSFRTLGSDNAAFTESVRTAVLRARFRPAEVAGQKVRQLVQQQFAFVLVESALRR